MLHSICVKQFVKDFPKDIILRSCEISFDEDDEFYSRSAMHVYARYAEDYRVESKDS